MEIDNSGKPRTSEELTETLAVVEKVIVTQITEIPPSLAVYLGVIREALIELLNIRKMM